MDDLTLTTANKYTVTYHAFINYDQFLEVQRAMADNTQIDTSKKDEDGNVILPEGIGLISTGRMFDFPKLLIKYLVVKIANEKGEEIKREQDSLPLPPQDSKEIMGILSGIFNEAVEVFEDKKKVS